MATKQPGDRATRWLGDRATKPLVDSWPCGVSGTGRRNNATSTSASTLTEVSQDSLLADTSASGELSPKQNVRRADTYRDEAQVQQAGRGGHDRWRDWQVPGDM
jgi:hypothetical protein